MIKIGITGGIGSGKTVVSHLLEIMGIPVFYADDEARKLTAASIDIREKLTATFGSHLYKNGVLDKAAFSATIFNDTRALAQANAIIHPAVSRAFEDWAEKQNSSFVAMEAAILFESGFDAYMDRIITVTAPVETRIARVMKRDAMNKEQIMARMNSQFSDEEKTRRADYVIVNDEKHALISQTVNVLRQISGSGYTVRSQI